MATRVGAAAFDGDQLDAPAPRGQSRMRELPVGMDRPLYTISVASEILDTHPRTLMMYESMGLIEPQRTSTNRRRYSPRDVQKLRTIQQLTRSHRVNIAGVRYILALLTLLDDNGIEPPDDLRDIDVSQLTV